MTDTPGVSSHDPGSEDESDAGAQGSASEPIEPEPVEPEPVEPEPVEPEPEPVEPEPVEPERVEPESVEHGELIQPAPERGVEQGSVTEPAKVMRIGSMVKQLLDEVRQAPLDERSRERLAEIYERSVTELSEALSPDLQEELRSLALPFEDDAVPSDGELRVAQAQLVGWLEGLFHGIQATLFAQQFAARQQLEQMRQLPPGAGAEGPDGRPSDRPGTYL